MDMIFLIGRIMFGGVFLMFGIMHLKDKKGMAEYIKSKNVPSPELSNFVAAVALILSGALIILGIFPDVALLIIVGFLIVVSVTMHNFWAIKDGGEKQKQMISFMINMALAGASIMLIWLNSWPLSL